LLVTVRELVVPTVKWAHQTDLVAWATAARFSVLDVGGFGLVAVAWTVMIWLGLRVGLFR